MKNIIASVKQYIQTSPDDYTCYMSSMICNSDTTIGEIIAWAQKATSSTTLTINDIQFSVVK